MKKKLLLLSSLFIISILTSTAQYTKVTQGNAIFYYQVISGNDIWIAGIDKQSPVFLNGDDTLTIPAILDGKNVKEIGMYGHLKANPRGGTDPMEGYQIPNTLKHIIIEEGIEKIKTGSFDGTKSFETLSLPSTLKTIESFGFARCTMKKLIIPNSVTNVGEFAFFSCEQLEYAKMSEGVTTLSNYVFRICSKLRTLDIRTCTSLGQRSINLCDSLRTLIISPNLISFIDDGTDNDTFYETRRPDTVIVSTNGNPISAQSKTMVAYLHPEVIEIEENYGTLNINDFTTMATGGSQTLILNKGNTLNVTTPTTIDHLILKTDNEQQLAQILGENLTLTNGITLEYSIPNNSRWHHLSLPFDCSSWSARAAEGTDVTNSINTYWRMQTFDSNGYAATTQVANADPWSLVNTRPTTLSKGIGYAFLNRLMTIPINFTFNSANNFVISTPNNAQTTITKYENTNGDPSLQNWNFIGFHSLQNVGETENVHVSAYDGYLEGIEPIVMVLNENTYTQTTLSSTSLKPCQAFFMQIASLENATGSITINPNTAPFLASSTNLTYDIVPIHFKSALHEDITTLYIGDRFTDNYETGADFLKFYGTDTIKPRISTIVNQYNLSFAAFPVQDKTKTIPLNIYAKKGTQYTFSIENSNLKNSDYIYLVDKKTNSQHDLLQGEYTWTPSENIQSKTRFELRIHNILSSTESIKASQNIWTEDAHIHIEYTNDDKELIIYGVDGKLIEKYILNAPTNTFISKKLKPGVYVLKIISNNQTQKSKVIIH